MAEPLQKLPLVKQPDGDEIERSIELLDRVLSEFEDPESLPPIEPDSPSQGHQSEDDGYMSMNGKKTSALNIIEVDGNNVKNKKQTADTKIRNDILKTVDSSDAVPLQTTLPKARPSNVIPSKYASLPCSTPPRLSNHHQNAHENYFHGGRTVLGIGISAVHDAVLRGITRMPEPILNEHPVTIYPGRASPTKKVPPRTLPGLLERHRDVCRKSIDSSQELSQDNNGSKSSINIDSSLDYEEQSIRSIIIRSPNSPECIPVFNNTISILPCSKSTESHRRKSDDEDFSDDSLEGTSLPPPPPPPLVPPKPSLSAPVTPSKRGSIAWEINLNEKATDVKHSKTSDKYVATNLNTSQISIASTPGSITSTDQTCSSDWPDPPEPPICSTEDEAGSIVTDSDDIIPHPPSNMVPNGTYVIRKGRKERQRLIDIDAFQTFVPPEISDDACKETDQDEDDIDDVDNVVEQNGIDAITSNSLNGKINVGTVPSYRHSIDLTVPTLPTQFSAHSPRARLSLNLNLPTSDHTDVWAYNNASNSVLAATSPRHSDYKLFCSKLDGLQPFDHEKVSKEKPDTTNIDHNNSPVNNNIKNELNVPLMRVSSLPTITPPAPPPSTGEILTTPRRELAPPIEEDEEQDSESQRGAPLRQIENNISALLRGDIAVARVGDIAPPRRPVGFRAGVHKSESAKEMLLSQNMFGPLPPSPPTSSPEETDGFPLPPLPPSPLEVNGDSFDDDAQVFKITSLSRGILDGRYRDTLDHPPAIPPHRGPPPTMNTLKTRSMDAGFTKCYKNNGITMSPHAPGTLPQDLLGSGHSRRRIMSGAFPKRSAQSPREERRLQTSCSLPETPIFARGCDVPRTPHRRTQELPVTGCSRTAPRQPNGLNSSIIGIAGSTLNGRQPNRSINHALASSEMLRMSGGPARGWYPKQRQPRPASTENLDRIHPQGSIRAWDTGTGGSRKPLTLPPNLSPNFFNKSPREALRRVTSLLIRKGNNGKDTSKKEKDVFAGQLHRSFDAGVPNEQATQKKKGFFKSFWKKSKHYSLDQ